VGASVPARRPRVLFLAVSLLVLGLDQWTKALARAGLSPASPRPLLGDWIRLSLVHNTGSAFGLVEATWPLLVIGFACLVAIPLVVASRPGLSQLQTAWLAAIWGGSTGNLLDRLRAGGVTDFIDLRVWPVFNVADIAITLGFIALAIQLVLRR